MSVSLPLGQSARRASILVVDDNVDVAQILFSLREVPLEIVDPIIETFHVCQNHPNHLLDLARLLAHAYVMHFAASGEQALERLADEIEPQLIVILSDINMPGMDGLELLGEIKQRHPDLPVMMVTAYGDDERRRRAHELGAIEFITKPVDFDQLKAQLRQLLAAD